YQPLTIDRARDQFGADKRKDITCLIKSGIFHPCYFTLINQRERARQHGLLHPAHDDDLVGMTISAAEVAQVSSDCLPQFDLATARGITQQVRSLLCQNLRSQAFPNSNRKFVHRWQPRDEYNA